MPRWRRWAARAGLFSSACWMAAGSDRISGVLVVGGVGGARSAANSTVVGWPLTPEASPTKSVKHPKDRNPFRPEFDVTGRHLRLHWIESGRNYRIGRFGGIDRLCGPAVRIRSAYVSDVADVLPPPRTNSGVRLS